MTQHGCQKFGRQYFGAPPLIPYSRRCSGGYCVGFREVCECGFETGRTQAIEIIRECDHHREENKKAIEQIFERGALPEIRKKKAG